MRRRPPLALLSVDDEEDEAEEEDDDDEDEEDEEEKVPVEGNAGLMTLLLFVVDKGFVVGEMKLLAKRWLADISLLSAPLLLVSERLGLRGVQLDDES